MVDNTAKAVCHSKKNRPWDIPEKVHRNKLNQHHAQYNVLEFGIRAKEFLDFGIFLWWRETELKFNIPDFKRHELLVQYDQV